MKILVIGAGVIGVTYAWQISKAGYDVTVYVRKGKKEKIAREGFGIDCLDLRKGGGRINTVFRPVVIDDFDSHNVFDLIIVAGNSNQLDSILTLLSKKQGRANVMFLQNIWGGFEDIEKRLKPGSYLFGFPFIMGGGRKENMINSVILNSPLNATMLGEKDGKISARLREIEKMMRKAGLQPRISKKIIPWLITHYIWAAGTIGAVLKAGGAKSFADNPVLIRDSYLSMREGFRICKKMGINPLTIYPVNLFYLPFLILVPFTRRLYRDEGMQLLVDGHISHSPEEMRVIYSDVIEVGRDYGVAMPRMKAFQNVIDSL
jgi:ketopantoate reductase